MKSKTCHSVVEANAFMLKIISISEENSFSTVLSLTRSLYKKWNFPLMISSVNVVKSAENRGFGQIYWRNI